MTRPRRPRAAVAAVARRLARPLAGAGPVDRRPADRRVRHAQPAQGQGPVRRQLERQRERQRRRQRRRCRTVTPAPSNVVVVPPEVVTFKGSIVYAKAGNIWVQTGKDAKQLTTAATTRCRPGRPTARRSTSSGRPTATAAGRPPGVLRDYAADDPDVMRVKADGSGDPSPVLNGRVTNERADVALLDPRAGRVAGREDHGDGLRPPGPVEERRRPPVLRPDHQEVDASRTLAETAAARPPGPGLATRRQGPALRPQRPRRAARARRSIYRWTSRRSKGTPLTGPGYLEPSSRPTAGTSPRPRPAPSATTS